MDFNFRTLKISPNENPQDTTMYIEDITQQLHQFNGESWSVRPFGDKFSVQFTLNGKDIGLPFNRLLIDGNGNVECPVYGTLFIAKRASGMTDEDIEMLTRLFSLEECAKPVEERVKLIKAYFPDGVESNMKMPEDYRGIEIARPSPSKQTYVPHCPICGSPDIEKITLAQKAFGGFMFGLFSKTAKSQFKCNNCGAKF